MILGSSAQEIEVDPHGYIRVDEELGTGMPGIWTLGECNGRGAFTHTADNDFEIVAANLLDGAGSATALPATGCSLILRSAEPE